MTIENLFNWVLRLTYLSLVLSLSQCTSSVKSEPNLTQTSSDSKAVVASNSTQYIWNNNPTETWHNLQQYSSKQLNKLLAETNDPIEKAWLNLAILSKTYHQQPDLLYGKIEAWKKENQNHPALPLFPERQMAFLNKGPRQIAVLLPQHGIYSRAGEAVKQGFLNAYFAQKSQYPNQTIRFYDTSSSSDMSALYQQALAEGADMVVGPLIKENVRELAKEQIISQPIIALNYSENSFHNRLYQFGLLPEDEAIALATRAYLNGMKSPLIIAPNNTLGKRLARAFAQRWESNQRLMNQILYYSTSANLKTEMENALPSKKDQLPPFDSVILFTTAKLANQIVPIIQANLPKTIPIYATSGVSNYVHRHSIDNFIVCELPRLRKNTKAHDQLYAVGQDAYLLSINLDRMISFPSLPIYGSTGALTLTANHQIHRNVPCR